MNVKNELLSPLIEKMMDDKQYHKKINNLCDMDFEQLDYHFLSKLKNSCHIEGCQTAEEIIKEYNKEHRN